MTIEGTVPVPCPNLPELPDGVLTGERSEVETGTACVALMDSGCAADVWEDLVFDGTEHDHGAGLLMVNRESVGTHVDYDGHFPVTIWRDEKGHARALRVELDPYASSELFHPPATHGHGHGHGHVVDGWSTPVVVGLRTGSAVFGDPAGIPEADGTGGLIELEWPAEAGRLHASVNHVGGVRHHLDIVWTPGN